MERREHCIEGQRKVIKKLLSFALIRHLLGVSNGLITNAKKNFSPKDPKVCKKTTLYLLIQS